MANAQKAAIQAAMLHATVEQGLVQTLPWNMRFTNITHQFGKKSVV